MPVPFLVVTSKMLDTGHYTLALQSPYIVHGNLPSKKVGTFTAAQRKAASTTSSAASSTTSASADVNTIKSVQTMLKALKYYGGELTGHFGGKTKEAVRQFQRDHDISADGVAGPKTLEAIDKALGSSSSSSSRQKFFSLKDSLSH